jgi:hypothetical protein
MGEMRNAYSILVENLKGKDHLEDIGIYGRIITMDPRETGWEDVDWMHLT